MLVTDRLYAFYLEPWYEAFGSDVLVVSTDSLKGDNLSKTMNSTYSHMGLPPYEVSNEVCIIVFKFYFFTINYVLRTFPPELGAKNWEL